MVEVQADEVEASTEMAIELRPLQASRPRRGFFSFSENLSHGVAAVSSAAAAFLSRLTVRTDGYPNSRGC